MQEDESGFTFIPIKPMKTITIPREQISSIVKPGHDESLFMMLCDFVRFCRNIEKEYQENQNLVSGMFMFTHILQIAGIEDSLFLTLRLCILDYSNPYKIVFGDVDAAIQINDN